MKFFTDYRNLKCNYEQFEFIKPYLYADGWSWYSDELTPKDLVMIQPHRSYIETWFKNPNENKFFIPYYEDEVEYLTFDKDVVEIIREIKLNELL